MEDGESDPHPPRIPGPLSRCARPPARPRFSGLVLYVGRAELLRHALSQAGPNARPPRSSRRHDARRDLELPWPFDLVVDDLPRLLERLGWCRHGRRAGEPQAVLVIDRHDEPRLPRQVEAVEVVCFGLENHPRFSGADMGHKYGVGQDVYYSPPALRPARTRSSAGCQSNSRAASPTGSRAPSRSSSEPQMRASSRPQTESAGVIVG